MAVKLDRRTSETLTFVPTVALLAAYQRPCASDLNIAVSFFVPCCMIIPGLLKITNDLVGYEFVVLRWELFVKFFILIGTFWCWPD